MRVEPMRSLWFFGFLISLSYMPSLAFGQSVKPIELVWPVACQIGKDCEIQQYMDHDRGPGAKDYMCGSAVYDDHSGTDIRLPDKRSQNKGVAVLAAADGTVLSIRNSEPDFGVGQYNSNLVKDKECGNGIVIQHRDGWETQYCHMRQGSVGVIQGQSVKAGQVLGLVGQSGMAAFIHLHLSVRKDGQRVDPFDYNLNGTCNAKPSQTNFLWRRDLWPSLAYKNAVVMNMGFSGNSPDMNLIESGQITSFTPQSPAIIFYIRALNLKQSDLQILILTGPNGETLAETKTKPLDKHKAQFMQFIGKKRGTQPFTKGIYKGRYQVFRDGALILDKTIQITLA
jgi:hypothetical protein